MSDDVLEEAVGADAPVQELGDAGPTLPAPEHPTASSSMPVSEREPEPPLAAQAEASPAAGEPRPATTVAAAELLLEPPSRSETGTPPRGNDLDLTDRARDLHATGMSYRDIGAHLDVSHTTIRRWLHPEQEWTVAGVTPLLPSKETLTGALIDGTIHARYPTGRQTLCGLSAPDHEANHFVPDCGRCSRIARAWDKLDGAMPAHWKSAA